MKYTPEPDEIYERGTLTADEYHPAANSAMRYVNARRLDIEGWLILKEALASTAIEGNRTAEILLSTVDWWLKENEPDRDAEFKAFKKKVQEQK